MKKEKYMLSHNYCDNLYNLLLHLTRLWHSFWEIFAHLSYPLFILSGFLLYLLLGATTKKNVFLCLMNHFGSLYHSVISHFQFAVSLLFYLSCISRSLSKKFPSETGPHHHRSPSIPNTGYAMLSHMLSLCFVLFLNMILLL